jgi:ERCC4-type nuclease
VDVKLAGISTTAHILIAQCSVRYSCHMTSTKVSESESGVSSSSSSSKPSLMVDSNEASTQFFKSLPSQDKMEVLNISGLPVDYIIEGIRGTLTVERKTASDFISSIRDGRLFNQLRVVSETLPQASHAYLVYGSLRWASKWSRTGGSLAGVMSTLSSLIVDWRTTVMFFNSEKDAQLFLSTLVLRVGKPRDRSVSVSIYKPKLPTVQDSALYLLSSLPNIGITTARELLQLGSVIEVLTLLSSSGDGVPILRGLTPDRLKKIREVLLYRLEK